MMCSREGVCPHVPVSAPLCALDSVADKVGPRARDPEAHQWEEGSRHPARPGWGLRRSLAPERRGQGWCQVSLPRPLSPLPCFLRF